jgi:hypothetical protein
LSSATRAREESPGISCSDAQASTRASMSIGRTGGGSDARACERGRRSRPAPTH